MVCTLIENMMDLHAQGRLVRSQARWVEAHASGCAKCAAELAAWRSLFQELRSLPALSAPQELKARLKLAARDMVLPKMVVPAEEIVTCWWPERAPSMALAFGLTAFVISISASIFGPGVPTQSCGSDDISVCLTFFESPNSTIRRNP